MLEDLVQVIETIQRRIVEHRPSLSGNETRTRMALIDPLLTVLGGTEPSFGYARRVEPSFGYARVSGTLDGQTTPSEAWETPLPQL